LAPTSSSTTPSPAGPTRSRGARRCRRNPRGGRR
jgi:hypothetical protein